MRKLIKIALSLIAIVVLLIVVAAVVAPLLIDPNDYKPQIATAVKENTGREVEIEGDLDLSVFPWLGLETGKLSLGNAPGFGDQPFAEIEATQIKVKLFPLLSKKVEVSRIVVKGLHLNLAKNKNGISNWEDLTTQPEPEDKTVKEQESPEPAQEGSGLAAFAVGGISVEDTNIVWDDQQNGQHVEISDFSFFMDQLSFDQPVGFESEFTVHNQEPNLTEKLQLSGNFSINSSLDIFQLNDVKLISKTEGDNIPGGSLNTELTLSADADLQMQTANVTGLELNVENLTVTADLKGQNILDAPIFQGPITITEFSPRKLLKSLSLDIPETSDQNTLQKLQANFQLHATNKDIALNDISIQLDDTLMKGNTKIVNLDDPAIRFNFDIDQIDVDRYLPPPNRDQQNEDTGQSESSSSPAVPPSTAAAGAAAQLPMETLRGLNLQGKIKISQFKAGGVKARGVELDVQGKNGLIQSEQRINSLYQGNYNGNMRIDARGAVPEISLNEALSNVQIEPLLLDATGKAPISGTAQFKAQLNGRGSNADAIKSSLTGTIDALFTDGAVKGINIIKLIRAARTVLKKQTTQTASAADKTEFSELKFSSTVNNGLVNNHLLDAKSPMLRVNGSGKADLVNESLDYQIVANVVGSLDGQGGADLKDLTGIPIAIDIDGPFSKLSYKLNLAEMLNQKQKAKVEEKKQELLEKLDKKIGPEATDLLKQFF